MRIRGIDHTRINVTINGIALNDAESQGSWFTNLPDFGAHVQNLEVQRGAGTSNNGSSAFGATMNFSTLAPTSYPYVELSSSAGSFYTFRNAITASTGLLYNRLSVSAAYSNVLSRGYIEHSSAKLHSVYFVADYHIRNDKKNKDFGHLSCNILYGNEKTGLAWNGVPSDYLSTNRTYNSCGEYYDTAGKRHYYENETDNYQQLHTQLHYDWNKRIDPIHRIHLRITAHFTRGLGYYEEYQDDSPYSAYGLNNFENKDTTDLITRKYLNNYFYGAAFTFVHHIGTHYTWILGGAANRYQGKEYGTIEWLQYAKDIKKGHHWYDGIGDKRKYNIFGKFIYNFTNNTLIYGDLQYQCVDYRIGGQNSVLSEVAQNHVWNFLTPKVGAQHRWNQKTVTHTIYTSFSMANREPTRADLTDAIPSQRPKPETLYDVELGYMCNHQKFSINANGYFMYYVDQLILTGKINDVGAAVMSNVDKSFRTGIELSTTYRPVRWFEWKINGTFSMNKIFDYTEYVDDWDSGQQRVRKLGMTDISFSPNIVAANEFHFIPIKNFDISLITKYVSRQYIDNSSNRAYTINPYCVSNLHLNYRIITKPVEISIFFHINNLFNTKYESNAWLYRYILDGKECSMDGYFPQAGINFMGGVSLKFK